MGSESSEVLSAIRALQDQLQQLTLAVDRLTEVVGERRQHSPRIPASVGGSPYRAPSSAASTTSLDYNRLAAEIPRIPASVLDLAASLRRPDATERAERAWTIGYWARFVLQGLIAKPRPSTPCGLANTIYVVLRAPNFEVPLVCTRGCDYRHVVGDFNRDTLSHGFASLAEAKIYCAGAGVSYPTTIFEWRPR